MLTMLTYDNKITAWRVITFYFVKWFCKYFRKAWKLITNWYYVRYGVMDKYAMWKWIGMQKWCQETGVCQNDVNIFQSDKVARNAKIC